MRQPLHLMIKRLIMVIVLFHFCNTPGFAMGIIPSFHQYSKEAVFEYFLNYPFSSYQDITTLHEQLQFFPFLVKNFSVAMDSQDVLATASAFTSTVPENGEQISLVIFSHSKDKAIKRLRNEIRLSPPKGGAIIHVYPSKEAMPFPIRSLFQNSAQGITQWCRFIAINAENKSPDELADIVSHELVHAYLASYLGVNNNRLPQWFNEGLALYLSSSKDQYIVPWGLNWQLTSRVTNDYAEYHLVFRFLDSKLGRRGVAALIHQVILQRAIEAPLQIALGLDSYDSLRDQALQWQTYQQNMSTLLFAIFLVLVICGGGWLLHEKQVFLRNEAKAQVELSQATATLFDQQISQAEQQIADSTSAEKSGIILSRNQLCYREESTGYHRGRTRLSETWAPSRCHQSI